ncbi:MAG: glycosyltransferase family 1 protein [Patescibacteria group bacterium]
MILGIDASRANVREKTGVEWYAWRIIQELKNIIPADVRVILYSREPLEGALAHLPRSWESRIIKAPFHRLWTQLGLSLEVLMRKPDALFVPAHVIPLFHPKSVMTLHDIGSIRYPKAYSWFDRVYHRWSTKFALRHAARIITPSRFTAQEIQEVFGREMHAEYANKIEVIHLGADASAQNGAPASSVRIPDDPYIVHIGRLERKKGTLDLIRAFEIVKEDDEHRALKLVLIGRVGKGSEEIDGAVSASPYADDIYRLGWLPESEKQQLLRRAHLFVFPSEYEGFGIPLLEAAAAGVPTVARRVGSLIEIASPGLVRWFDESDELPSVLKEALQDTEWRAAARRDGPRHATRFSWRAAAMRTWEVLESVLREQPAM